MASHRTLEGRNPIWRAMTAILGVIALVVAMVASAPAVSADPAPISIPPIQMAIANQHAATSTWVAKQSDTGACLKYLPGDGLYVTQSVNGGNVTQASEALGSHGYSSKCSDVDSTSYDSMTSDPSALGVVPASTSSITPGMSFPIGIMLHHNNTISSDPGQYFIGDMNVKLGSAVFTIPWRLWETPNTCTSKVDSEQNSCADDIVQTAVPSQSQTAVLGGVTYTLVLDGFYNATVFDKNNTSSARNSVSACTQTAPKTKFITTELKITTACLYGHLAQVGTFTISKDVVNSTPPASIGANQKYTIGYDCVLNGSSVAAGSVDLGDGESASMYIPEGAKCTVTETSPADGSATGLPTPGYHWSVGYSSPNPVTIQANATSTVTVTNTVVAETPHLTLKKTVDNANGGTKSATDWTLKAQHLTDTAVINAKGSSTDNGATATIGVDVQANVPYTLSESGPGGYTPGSWQCTDDTTHASATLTNGAVSLTQGQHVTCAITNTAVAATGTMTKTVTSEPTQNSDGTWTIGYTIVVTNSSKFSNYVYNLVDDLQFGGGITVNSASWTGPGASSGTFTPPGAVSATLATGRTLAPNTTTGNATDTYVVTVNATVGQNATSTSVQCDSGQTPSAGGFLNRATVTHGTESIVEYACAQPGLPTISKSGNPATQNSDGSWNVSYDIAITNPTNTAIQANLTDTWPTLPSGWTQYGDWAIAKAATADSSQPGPGHGSSSGGNTEIWSGPLPASTTYRFSVSGKIMPSASAQSIGECSETNGQSGLHNTATVTSGGYSASAPGCVSIPGAGVEVAKSVAAVNQLANGDWQIDYTVTVTNQSAEYSTFYTLTDTPALGTGFTVKSQGWEGVSPATNQSLAKKTSTTGVDTYTYRVVASFDSKVADPQLTCNTDNVGAFANSVTVTFPGGSDTAGACAPPKSPTVTKTFAGATQNSDGNWVLTYDVAVTNGTGQTLAYTVDDTAATLPAGATAVGDWTVTGPSIANGTTGTDSGTRAAEWNGSGKFATGLITSGATHTYTTSRAVSLSADASSDNLQCVDGDSNHTKGLWNTATVTNGVGGNTSSACGGIQPPSVDLAKTVTSTVQQPDGSWVITYAVTATNNNDTAAVYSLTDELQFGGDIAVSTATWRLGTGGTQNFSGSPLSATLATDKSLSAHTTDTYTVVVTATVPSTAWNSDHSTLACTTGEQYSAGGFLNTATITSGGTQVTKHDCSEPVQPTVKKKFVSATPNSAGGWDVTYTVTVTNRAPAGGPSTTYDLSDTPTFPSDLTVTAAAATLGTASVGTWDSNTKTLTAMATGKSLAAGASDVYTIVVSTAKPQQPVSGDVTECGAGNPSPGQGFYNRANLSSGGVDSYDDACGSIPSWTVEKAVDRDVANPDDILTFTLTATNTGSVDLTNVVATDTLPAGVEVLNTSTHPLGNEFKVDGTKLTWTIPSLPAGAASVTATYYVQVKASAAGTTQVNLIVPTTPGGQCTPVQEPAGVVGRVDVGNTDANCTTTTDVPRWTLRKVSDPPTGSTVAPGQTITYTLTVTNKGPGVLNGATVTDELKGVLNNATFVAGSITSDPVGGSAALDANTSILTWYVSDGLGVGKTATVTYKVQVNSGAYSRTLDNVATPGSPAGQCEQPEGAEELTDVNCTTTHRTPNPPQIVTPSPATLTITKLASPGTTPIHPGDAFTYTLTVSNTSTQPANSVKVSDPIPSDIAISGTTSSGWTCTVSGKDSAGFGGTLACNLLGSLNSGASAPAITLAATLSSTTTAVSVSNTGSVTWTNPDGSSGGPASSTAVIGVIEVAGESSEITPTTTSSAVIEVKPTSGVEAKPTSGAIAYTGVNTFGMGMLALLLLAGGALILGLGTVWRRKPRKH